MCLESLPSRRAAYNAILGLQRHQGIVLDIPSMRSGMHDRRDPSDFLTRQQSKEVDEVCSDVDRGSTTGKRGIKRPAGAWLFVPVRRTDYESERHVVEVRWNLSLGIFQGSEQVAYAEDERYRAIDIGFLRQFPKPGDLRHVDTAGLFQRERNLSRDQRFRDRRHFRMPTERECKIHFLAFEELMARLVETASVSRRNRLSLYLLRIRNGHHLDPARLERVEIERYVPMARLEQRNFNLNTPSVQGISG